MAYCVVLRFLLSAEDVYVGHVPTSQFSLLQRALKWPGQCARQSRSEAWWPVTCQRSYPLYHAPIVYFIANVFCFFIRQWARHIGCEHIVPRVNTNYKSIFDCSPAVYAIQAINTATSLHTDIGLCSGNRLWIKTYSYSCNRPWRPIGLRIVGGPTFSRQFQNKENKLKRNTKENGRSVDRCGLVVRLLGYRSGGPGSILGTTRKKKGSGSGTGSTQPREYNRGATW
jgi:hypothetical protein